MNKLYSYIIISAAVAITAYIFFPDSRFSDDVNIWDKYKEKCISGNENDVYKELMAYYIDDFFIYYKSKVHLSLDRKFCDGRKECRVFTVIESKENQLKSYLENSKERINDKFFDDFFVEIQRNSINKEDFNISNNKYSYLVGGGREIVFLKDCCSIIDRNSLSDIRKDIFKYEGSNKFLYIKYYYNEGDVFPDKKTFMKEDTVIPLNLCKEI